MPIACRGVIFLHNTITVKKKNRTPKQSHKNFSGETFGSGVSQSLNIEVFNELRHTPLHSRQLNDGDGVGGKHIKSVLSLSATIYFFGTMQIQQILYWKSLELNPGQLVHSQTLYH